MRVCLCVCVKLYTRFSCQSHDNWSTFERTGTMREIKSIPDISEAMYRLVGQDGVTYGIPGPG